MAQKRLPMRKVKKILTFHFDEGRSVRAIATHCGVARRSVAQTLERFTASGLSWPVVQCDDGGDGVDLGVLDSGLRGS